MKHIYIVISCVGLFSGSAYAQDTAYPKGAYLSFDEIVKKSPSATADLEVEKRTPGDIKMAGGNDYKLNSTDKSVANKVLKKEYWGYSLGDTLYLNCFQYKLQPWYAAVISDGNYLVFRGGISQNQELYKKQMAMGMAFGAIGGAIAGAKIAMMRFLYAIDKETNTVIAVDSKSLQELLSATPDLLRQFEQEPDKESEEVLLKYLMLLNTSE
ncbi:MULTISPECIES: DUF6563 family protein [unclassified Imperialibacter]|uniref:DUF6563 family protein n=1 Tax=unclassified Imperialibacter TaxID=2629706 RepID=UPI0012538F65|nr:MULTISPECIES: DUF6563 family protein [unclassified Imperialibacter]CAD5265101.1 conserved exported hypothetical protein [Imperialibacter sp. 89]CAD5269989.1 conserved exported hypothetical protein [Imperialibacter sp. 75]VVT09589.1 conserved exported hypothetical protein [Imperialibacter sp. EC-SDR9]